MVSGNINASAAWFVPLRALDTPKGAALQRAAGKPDANDTLVEDGGSFTITLETFCITGQHDDGSGNDLLVRSRTKYGRAPLTETINFFGIDIPAGQVQENLISEYIFAQDIYDGRDRVYLDIDITEIDKGLARKGSPIDSFNALKADFGAIFPTLFPFSSIAVEAISTLEKMLTRRGDKNEIIFQNALDFSLVGAEGEARLRCGAYVLFNRPVEAVQYRLRELKLEYFTPSQQGQMVRDDYVVIKIVPALINTGQADQLMQNQQLALVLSHANQQQADIGDRLAQRTFLQEFVQDAQKTREVKQFLTLKDILDAGLDLSPQQRETYLRLAKNLRGIIAILKG